MREGRDPIDYQVGDVEVPRAGNLSGRGIERAVEGRRITTLAQGTMLYSE